MDYETLAYDPPRAHIGMTLKTGDDGQLVRTSIRVFLAYSPCECETHVCENLLEAANLIGQDYQLCRLPENVEFPGVQNLMPFHFEWVKRLVAGAPWPVPAKGADVTPWSAL